MHPSYNGHTGNSNEKTENPKSSNNNNDQALMVEREAEATSTMGGKDGKVLSKNGANMVNL